MISPEKLAKQVVAFTDPLSRATFELGGTAQDTAYSVHVTGTRIRILIILDNDVAGQVGSFKLYDNDGTVVCSSTMTFTKVSGKKQYFAFEINMTERVI